jgi:uncharacterized protein YidB (DUF937 family)
LRIQPVGLIKTKLVDVLQAFLQKEGGVEGVIDKLKGNGLGSLVASWIGTGAIEPISASQIHEAVGDQHAEQIATDVVMAKHQLLFMLAQNLPLLLLCAPPEG